MKALNSASRFERISSTTVVSFSQRARSLARGAWNFDQATFLIAIVTIDSQRSGIWQISLLISIELLNIPSPTTLLPFRHARFSTLPVSFIVVAAAPAAKRCSAEQVRSSWGRGVRSKVRASLGHSPTGLAESSSLTLRTAHSPQVALHLSSRKRSYHYRLQGGNDTLEGTFTQRFNRLHRRTSGSRQGMLTYVVRA